MELTVAELKDAQGTDLGASEWLTVEQPRIDLFADATEDHQWVHVDPSRAADGPFGRTIAHGYLTLSLVPRLLEQILHLSDLGRGANYGVDRVRFTDAVEVGSRIRLAATIAEVEVRPDGGVRYTMDVRVDKEHSERPAMVGSIIYLAYGS